MNKLFWGILFLFLGISFFIPSFFEIDFAWMHQYWPAIFILIGLRFLLKDNEIGKSITTLVLFIFVGLLIFSAVTTVKNKFHDFYQMHTSSKIDTTSSERYDVPFFDKTEFVDLKIESAIGQFSITDENTSKSLEAYSTQSIIDYNFNTDPKNHKLKIDVSIAPKGVANTRVKLNQNLIWNIKMEAGASSTLLNLSKHKVKKLSIEAGASNLEIKFGTLMDSTATKIEAGASNMKLMIPKTIGCRIKLETSAANVIEKNSFDGFVKLSKSTDGEETYETPNFSSSKNKLFIDTETGASKFQIERY